MEVDIGRGSWKDLQQLRKEILGEDETGSVKGLRKLLMAWLSATIAEERQRNGTDTHDLDEMIVSLELKVTPRDNQSPGMEVTRREISMIVQLEDSLAEQTKKPPNGLLTW
ncbi:hypothetical protein P3T24_001769 [Paraburkholderia sp. GAS33]|uniref:hypothetical protein n=1 Tax=Paraburkholderia sp. GAS33 TaxID=3035130 RepID=UPI003D1BEBA9